MEIQEHSVNANEVFEKTRAALEDLSKQYGPCAICKSVEVRVVPNIFYRVASSQGDSTSQIPVIEFLCVGCGMIHSHDLGHLAKHFKMMPMELVMGIALMEQVQEQTRRAQQQIFAAIPNDGSPVQ